MESFFKDRTVVKKNNDTDDQSSDVNASPLTSLSDLGTTKEAEQDEGSHEETCEVFNADDEGYKVEIVKVNSEVTKIIVNCPCGKMLTLNCDYADVKAVEDS